MPSTTPLRETPRARLFKYHPERFFLLRSSRDWREAYERKEALIRENQNNRPLSVTEVLAEMLERESGTLVPTNEATEFDRGRIDDAISEDTSVGMASQLESVADDWVANGEQIFDLSAISAMFLGSDASQIPLDHLPLPYNSFYMYWGPHLQLASPSPNRFIDGCYVCHHPDLDELNRFHLTFTSSHPADDPWDERSLIANIVLDSEGATALVPSTEAMCDGATIADFLRGGLAANSREHSVRWEPYTPDALEVAANCLCYLAWERREIRIGLPSSAPPRLVKQVDSPRPTERRRAQSKLNALGFRVVHLCGERQAARLGLSTASKSLPPGWRKGHWRHQRVGKGRRNIKVLWIHATMVNADKGEPDFGHIYVP